MEAVTALLSQRALGCLWVLGQLCRRRLKGVIGWGRRSNALRGAGRIPHEGSYNELVARDVQASRSSFERSMMPVILRFWRNCTSSVIQYIASANYVKEFR